VSNAAREAIFPQITEKRWREAIVRFALFHRWDVYWTWRSDNSPSGFPDLVLVRGDRCLFVELKSEQGKLTKNQQHWAEVLSRCGSVEYFKWRPSDEDLVWELLK